MKRMYELWIENNGFSSSKQQLRTQVQNIVKQKLLTKIEREEIEEHVKEEQRNDLKRKFDQYDISPYVVLEKLEVDNSNNESQDLIQVGMEKEPALRQVTVVVNRIDVCEQNGCVALLRQEEKDALQRLREIMLMERRDQLPLLKKVNNKQLKKEVDLINRILGNVTTDTVTDTNKLLYSAAYLVTERLGKMKKAYQQKRRKEPWWKRRIGRNINEWRKDLGRLEARRKGQFEFEGREMERMNRKYDLGNRGNIGVIEMLKQKIHSGATKVRRFDERNMQYHQNSLFATNQKQLYKELRGDESVNEKPDAGEATVFWSNIWSNPGTHNIEARWISKVKESLQNVRQQQNIAISIKSVKNGIKRMTNWKAPGPDGVQGYWFKRFSNLHSRIAQHLQECVETGSVPEWMTTGRTSLIQKDVGKGKIASNYRPITCLPLMWKLLTSVISERMYEHLLENNLLPDEQKGCRKKSRGTKDQLLIDKRILKHCKRNQRNLAMAWIDYRKAYDMVPHSWLLESLKMVGVADNVIQMLENSMQKWKTELTACGDKLGEVKINRGIFQGDSLSPLLFVVTLIPLSLILRDTEMGYDVGIEGKLISHLLFMDDLKIYAASEDMLNSLIQTVRIFSSDIGMEFGLDKCGVLVMKRGKVVRSEGIELPNGQKMAEIDLEGYKYLGILEYDEVKSVAMKEKVKKEYFKRVKKLLGSKLNGGNVIGGINAWAIGIIRYGAGIIDWTRKELRDMDVKTRKMMTLNGTLHPRANVSRLYLPRKDGGRGLIGCEDCVDSETKGLNEYVVNSNEWMLKWVRTDMEGIEEMGQSMEEKRAQLMEQWHEKPLHGKFVKDTNDVRGGKSWDWLRGGHLKKETEALICAAQDQALATNSIKAHIYKEDVPDRCRLCGQSNETVMHIVGGCSTLAGKEYKTRHDRVGTLIHWLLLKKWNIVCADKWYNHTPEAVTESENGKIVILWDTTVLTDRKVHHNKPDVLVKDHENRMWYIIDFAVPMDAGVDKKEAEKKHNYMDLATEIRRQYQVKTKIIPFVIGALGTVPKKLEKSFEILEIPDVTGSMQTAALLGSAAILRRVLSL